MLRKINFILNFIFLFFSSSLTLQRLFFVEIYSSGNPSSVYKDVIWHTKCKKKVERKKSKRKDFCLTEYTYILHSIITNVYFNLTIILWNIISLSCLMRDKIVTQNKTKMKSSWNSFSYWIYINHIMHLIQLMFLQIMRKKNYFTINVFSKFTWQFFSHCTRRKKKCLRH